MVAFWKPKPGNVLILDNRDSFVYNLAHRFHEVDVEVGVVRSDAITVDDVIALNPSGIVISPGPGHPITAGCSVDVIATLGATVPILGVCLGHQAIGLAYGGRVSQSGSPRHGKPSTITHDGMGIFAGVPDGFEAARYHSLIVESPLPDDLIETAWCDGFIMGMRHTSHPVIGVQFHPESILTTEGLPLLRNFKKLVGQRSG